MRIRRLFVLMGIAVACALAGSFILGSHLSAPCPATIGSPPADLPVQTIEIPSESGSTLSGWFIPSNESNGAVLLMHGIRSDRRGMLGRAEFLNQAGYSVMLFDLQAHGESIGKHITFGYLESRDAKAAFDDLQQRTPGKPIGVIGVSLGGAAALLGPVAESANALILEAVYPTFEEAVANRIEMRLGPVGRYLTPLLVWQIQPRLGFDPNWLAPIERIVQVETPVLIIAGTEDRHTPLAESRRLFDRAVGPKEIWTVEGAAHEDFHHFAPEEYQRRMLRFWRDACHDCSRKFRVDDSRGRCCNATTARDSLRHQPSNPQNSKLDGIHLAKWEAQNFRHRQWELPERYFASAEDRYCTNSTKLALSR